MASYTTVGVTLHQHPVGEYDKVLVLFTRDHGIVRVMAKGARRAASKLGGKSEPLHLATWFLGKGRNLDVVAQCETLHAFRPLRDDLDRLLSALYLAEIALAALVEGHPHPDVFDSFIHALEALETAAAPELVVAWFEVALLGALGYGPELEACVQCGEAVEEDPHGFSAEAGGVLCASCTAVGAPMRLAPKALQLLRRLAAVEVDAVSPHSLPEELLAAARRPLRAALTLRSERPLRGGLPP